MCNIFYLGILVTLIKREITMATLTKKDLLEAIEDIPMDAEITQLICLLQHPVKKVVYDELHKTIVIC
jgi:hypothetical protein